MKRLRSTRSWTYDSLMLYREDLEELLRIFNPSGGAGLVKISDSGAEYDSLDEMKAEKGSRIDHITLKATKPFIVMNLQARPKALNLYTVEATDEADVAFFKANEFLQPKRRPLNTFVIGYAWQLGLIGFLLIAVFSGLAKFIEKTSWLWLIYPGIGLVALFVVSLLDKRTALFVSLCKRHESPSFPKRKKDELIMLAIGTLLGLIISVIIGRFRR
jgi:hypothetical protein